MGLRTSELHLKKAFYFFLLSFTQHSLLPLLHVLLSHYHFLNLYPGLNGGIEQYVEELLRTFRKKDLMKDLGVLEEEQEMTEK